MEVEIATALVQCYKEEQHKFHLFLKGVYDFFMLEPELNLGNLPPIHSLRSRLKDPEHLYEKLLRKDVGNNPITTSNFFERITDLAGVRVLHLYREQFTNIHRAIERKVCDGDWVYFEKPCAYTWDPETETFYTELGLRCEIRPSLYTSVHYVIMPKEGSPIKCEIQVRTLFEEIWGEIDHSINYPCNTQSVACREQLRVLSKLSATGTRLADSIFNSYEEYLIFSQLQLHVQSPTLDFSEDKQELAITT